MAILDTVSVTGPNVTGPPIHLSGTFNVTATATAFVGAVVLERSYDGGTTYTPVGYPDGQPVFIGGPASVTLEEPNGNALYRFRGAAYTSGSINITVSQ